MHNTHKIHTYTIDSHPDPESVYDWVRDNWHDLGEHSVYEAIDSLKAFASYYDADLDYSIGIVSDRGEFISLDISEDISELSGVRLWKYLQKNYPVDLSGNCPFTGIVWDETLLDGIREFMKKPDSRDFSDLLSDCSDKLLSAIHSEGEYIYSDEGLKDLLEANQYEFTESGEFYA